MGTINNQFVCVEMFTYESTDISDAIHAVEEHEQANIVLGSNGYMFVSIAPSGSKEGWDTSKQHNNRTKELLTKLKMVDKDLIIKTVTTSYG